MYSIFKFEWRITGYTMVDRERIERERERPPSHGPISLELPFSITRSIHAFFFFISVHI